MATIDFDLADCLGLEYLGDGVYEMFGGPITIVLGPVKEKSRPWWRFWG